MAINEYYKNGIDELKREILASNIDEVIYNMNYVFYEKASTKLFPNGIRDVNNVGKTLEDFVNHPIAIKYQLRQTNHQQST